MRILITTCLSICLASHALASDSAQKMAAVEAAITPMLVIKGEPVKVPTLAERMRQLHVNAVSVAVFSGGKIEWAKAYGFADQERGTPATVDTLFQAGSISKSVTAVAALELVEQGTLNLDANVNDSLKSWHLPDNEFTVDHKVTVRNILNHTAGTTVWGFPGYARPGKVPSVIEVLEGKGNTEAIRVYKQPGASWRYSGGGYTILQQLMSDVSGKAFPALMQEKVLQPMGMRHSTFLQPLPEKLRSQAASGYNREGVPVEGDWHIYPEMAAAGLWTTPSDLAKFALAVQRSYAGQGGLLTEKMSRLMLTPGLNNDGLGFFISADNKRFGHGGADEGFQSNLTCFLETGAGVAVMANSDNGNRLGEELTLSIAREYGWSGFPQAVRSPVQLPREAYQRLAGHYKLDGAGEFDLTMKGEHLAVSGPGFPEREILAESANNFFIRDDGTPIEVSEENGAIVLKIGGTARAVKDSPRAN